MDAGRETRRVDAALITALVTICGADHVVSDPSALATFRSDAAIRWRQTPAVAVLPGTPAEVVAVVGTCADSGVAWVARGAGTGLSGGALGLPDGVLIVLSRLRRIISVDLADARVIVEPGVTNLAVSRAVAPTHFYPPDPASRRVCTIGGDVAENAGGCGAVMYGVTTDYVIGLDVVLADGSLVELRRDRPGYDLVGAFVGSEGTLGIVVAVHLRVVPVPESVRTMVACFDTPALAATAVSRIVAAGLGPTAMELVDSLAMRAAEAHAEGGYRADAGAALLIEFAGPREQSITGLEAAAVHCSRAGARDVRLALDLDERAALWATHEVLYAAMRRLSSAYMIQDGVVPRPRLTETLERIAALSGEFGLAVANILHAGDGALHPIICFDAGSAAESARARELADRILGVCLEAGGSIAAEHGVGLDKYEAMRAMYTEADLAAFRALRGAFDPQGLANPGKLVSSARD